MREARVHRACVEYDGPGKPAQALDDPVGQEGGKEGPVEDTLVRKRAAEDSGKEVRFLLERFMRRRAAHRAQLRVLAQVARQRRCAGLGVAEDEEIRNMAPARTGQKTTHHRKIDCLMKLICETTKNMAFGHGARCLGEMLEVAVDCATADEASLQSQFDLHASRTLNKNT